MRTIDRLPQVSAEDGKLRQRTIDQIRAAGLQLIYERGYEGMGLRLLARKAGIGQSTLYGHFATKQDLIDRFGQTELVQLTDRTNRPPLTPGVDFQESDLFAGVRRDDGSTVPAEGMLPASPSVDEYQGESA